MKKKVISLICVAILLIVLFVPFGRNVYDDGGSVKITALTYSVVKWKKLAHYMNEDGSYSGGFYEKTSIYLFPDNFKDLDDLWNIRH